MNELLPFITLEQYEALDAAFRGVYKRNEASNNYVLNVKPLDGYSLENVAGLKRTLAEITADRNERKRALAAFVDSDGNPLDPAAVQEALSKREEIKNWTPDEKTREIIASQVGQIKTKFEAEKASVAKERDELMKQIESLLVDNAARQALGAFELIPRGDELLMPHIKQAIRVVKDDETGEFVARVVDSKGNPRITMKQGETGFMGTREYVESMRSDDMFAPAFRASGASGTGGGNGAANGTNNNANANTRGNMSPNPIERLKELRRS